MDNEVSEPVLAIIEEQEVLLKIEPLHDYFVLNEVVARNPTNRILRQDGKTVPEDWPRWRIIAKGPECPAIPQVGDMVMLTAVHAGVDLGISGTPYKLATFREIVGILNDKAKFWTDETKHNLEYVSQKGRQGTQSRLVKPGKA